MLQGANSTGKAVAKTKLANIKSKNARASLANIQCCFHRTPRGGEVGLMSSNQSNCPGVKQIQIGQ